jgi:DNA replication protein DnaC
VPRLIVDDFALKPLRAPHDEDFHDLVAARDERAATILTSSLGRREWRDAFPDNCVLGAATLAIHRLSRLYSHLKHCKPLTATEPFFPKNVPKPFISR